MPFPSEKKPYTRLVSILWEILFVALLVLAGTILGLLFVYHAGTPDVTNIREYQFHLPTIIYDHTGTVELYRLYDEENRVIVSHDAIPDTVRLATIASEDTEFYTHRGIDPLAIMRAFIANFQSGRITQGGSTITQQLARALYLSSERTLERKVREALLALKIDHALSKDEILNLYLNTIPYGSNTYGIESAANVFFGKPARDLSLDESALLAALPNAPSYFSPYQGNEPKLRERQLGILQKMYTLGLISRSDYGDASQIDTQAKIIPRKEAIIAPHFVFAVLDELKGLYSEDELRTKGLRVVTTLDLTLQEAGEQAVKEGAKRNLSRGAENAALVAVDGKSGDILAMIGSRDYFDPAIDGNVNVTLEKRQPGSAFKPFAYATAFTKGFQPETPIYDTRINFGPDGTGKDYIPENYNGKFNGLLSMRQALSMSLNVPAVQTLALAGIPDTIALASAMGITTLTEPNRYGLSLVLGGAEVRPLDMANAFSVFGQEGLSHRTTGIKAISDRNGENITVKKKEVLQVLDPEVARKINSILSDNVARTPIFGPNSPLAFPKGVVVAGKTGTTQNFRDAWTVGYTPSIAVAVWAGNNNNSPMRTGADGIYVAAPIWRDFMNVALKQFPETGFTSYRQVPSLKTNSGIPTNSRTIYIENKTGREIPESKAKKMKKERYKTYQVGDASGYSFDLLPPLPEEGSPDTLSMNDIRTFYEQGQ